MVKIQDGKTVVEKHSFFIVADENNYDENGVQYCWFVIYDEESRVETDRTQNIHAATWFSTIEWAQKVAEYYNENYSKTGAVVIAVQETVKTVYKRM